MKILVFVALLAMVISKPSVLIVVDSWAIKDTHSLWFNKIREKFDVSIKYHEDNFKLMNYDEANYDHVMIITPSISKEE